MALIKKADVLAHFAARRQQRKGLNLGHRANKSATAGLPAIDQQAVKAGVPVLVEDIALEHSVPGETVPAFKNPATSADAQRPEFTNTRQS